MALPSASDVLALASWANVPAGRCEARLRGTRKTPSILAASGCVMGRHEPNEPNDASDERVARRSGRGCAGGPLHPGVWLTNASGADTHRLSENTAARRAAVPV